MPNHDVYAQEESIANKAERRRKRILKATNAIKAANALGDLEAKFQAECNAWIRMVTNTEAQAQADVEAEAR